MFCSSNHDKCFIVEADSYNTSFIILSSPHSLGKAGRLDLTGIKKFFGNLTLKWSFFSKLKDAMQETMLMVLVFLPLATSNLVSNLRLPEEHLSYWLNRDKTLHSSCLADEKCLLKVLFLKEVRLKKFIINVLFWKRRVIEEVYHQMSINCGLSYDFK